MSGVAARLTAFAALAVLMLDAAASNGGAAIPASAPIGGMVRHAGAEPYGLRPTDVAVGKDNVHLKESPCSLSSPSPCWVMRRNTTYAIYWVPSGSSVEASYESDIDRYLSDVAAASGSQTNVYSVATQYYDATGFIAYQSKFGGSSVDPDPFPASGCDDSYQGVQDPVCLTDLQLRAEIQKVITAKGWRHGRDTLFFIMTPTGVGTCRNSGSPNLGNECTTNSFCAYHSGFKGTNDKPILYADEPYAASIDGCALGPSPNGDDADATINTMSHEQNEAITDPWGDAWLNADGDEIADICAWKFGTSLGTATNGQPYNQLINGHPYALQEDYSNDGGTCLQHYVGLPANTVRPALDGVAQRGKLLSASRGLWTQVPTAYAYRWLRCKAGGGSCVPIKHATHPRYRLTKRDVRHRLRVRVTAVNAAGNKRATSHATARVPARH
jgi:hypothetical protein